MAQKVVLLDDLDGSEAAATVRFRVENTDYEIDLSEENIQRFHDALQPFIQQGRVIQQPRTQVASTGRGTRRRRSRSYGEQGQRLDIPQIRAWAEAKGYDVAPRGRIKREIIEEYLREHGSAEQATLLQTGKLDTPVFQEER